MQYRCLIHTNQETDRLPKRERKGWWEWIYFHVRGNRQQNNNRGFCGTPFLCLQQKRKQPNFSKKKKKQKRKQVLYYSRSATSDYALSFSLPTFVFQLAITFIFLDLEVRRFNALKTVWGLQQFLPLDTFNDLKNGYIFEGGHCEFGVDVIVASPLTNWEILSFDEKLSKPKFSWAVRKFSDLNVNSLTSDIFSMGGRKWWVYIYIYIILV